ncbi:hypothetical protein ACI2JA_03505 [Alkalihalobacillus sp. NPDC078783]
MKLTINSGKEKYEFSETTSSYIVEQFNDYNSDLSFEEIESIMKNFYMVDYKVPRGFVDYLDYHSDYTLDNSRVLRLRNDRRHCPPELPSEIDLVSERDGILITIYRKEEFVSVVK